MNYYKILEVSENASEEVIRVAYKAMVKKYHPDNFKGDINIANERIKEINVAYEILSNAAMKDKYDEHLKSETRTESYQSNDHKKSEENKYYESQKSKKEEYKKGSEDNQGGCLGCLGTIIVAIIVLYFIGTRVNEKDIITSKQAKQQTENTQVQTETTEVQKESIETNIVYNLENIEKSIEEYNLYTNPYFLESMKEYLKDINGIIGTIGNQKYSIESLKDLLISNRICSEKFAEEIYSLDTRDIYDDRIKRMDEKIDDSLSGLLKSDLQKSYFEVSARPKTTELSVFDEDYFFYYGDLKDNKPHGKGIMFSVQSDKLQISYIGEFMNGKMHGKGVLFQKEMVVPIVSYIGEFKENEFAGKGKMYDSSWYIQSILVIEDAKVSVDLDLIENKIDRYLKEGYHYGIIEYLAKRDSKIELKNIYTDIPILTGVAIYEGEFEKSQYNGKGTEYNTAGGLKYKGEVKKGEYSGSGRSYYINGQIQYEGAFVNGKYHGAGKLYNDDGSIRLEGEFKNEPMDVGAKLAHMISLYSIYQQNKEEFLNGSNGEQMLDELPIDKEYLKEKEIEIEKEIEDQKHKETPNKNILDIEKLNLLDLKAREIFDIYPNALQMHPANTFTKDTNILYVPDVYADGVQTNGFWSKQEDEAQFNLEDIILVFDSYNGCVYPADPIKKIGFKKGKQIGNLVVGTSYEELSKLLGKPIYEGYESQYNYIVRYNYNGYELQFESDNSKENAARILWIYINKYW